MDKYFFYLSSLCSQLTIEIETGYWHLIEYRFKELIFENDKTENIYGYETLEELYNDVIEKYKIKFNIQENYTDYENCYNKIIELSKRYDWIQLLYRNQKWQITSFYDIQSFDFDKKNRHTIISNNLMEVLNDAMSQK